METKKISEATEGGNMENVLSNMPEIGRRAAKLSKRIGDEQKTLKQKLDSIDKIPTGAIDLGRHWYGAVDLSTVEKSMVAIYSKLAGYIKDCGKGLRETNQNQIDTLGLVCLAIGGEVELFKQLNETTGRVDQVDSREAGFEDIFLEWCQKNNIKDEDVQDLLEQSFRRAYTLKMRMRELNERIEDTNKRVDDLDASLNARSKDIDQQLDSALNSISEKAVSSVDSISKKAETAISDQDAKLKEIISELAEKQRTAYDSVDAKIKELEKLEAGITARLGRLIEDDTSKIKTLSNDIIKQQKDLFAEHKGSLDKAHDTALKALGELKETISTEKKSVEESGKQLIRTLREEEEKHSARLGEITEENTSIIKTLSDDMIKQQNELFDEHRNILEEKHADALKVYAEISESISAKEKELRNHSRKVSIISSVITVIVLTCAYIIITVL